MVVLIGISLITSDVEHLFMLTICISVDNLYFFGKCLFRYLAIF